jgi:hypothetical protein
MGQLRDHLTARHDASDAVEFEKRFKTAIHMRKSRIAR